MEQNTFCTIRSISYPLWIKFGTGNVKKNYSSDYDFRENPSSEKCKTPMKTRTNTLTFCTSNHSRL